MDIKCNLLSQAQKVWVANRWALQELFGRQEWCCGPLFWLGAAALTLINAAGELLDGHGWLKSSFASWLDFWSGGRGVLADQPLRDHQGAMPWPLDRSCWSQGSPFHPSLPALGSAQLLKHLAAQAGREHHSSLLFPRAQNINHLCQRRSKWNMMKWSRYLKRFYKDLGLFIFKPAEETENKASSWEG